MMTPRIKLSSRRLLPSICLLLLYGCNFAGTPIDVSAPIPHAEEPVDPDPVESTEAEPIEPVSEQIVVEEAANPGTVILLSGAAVAYREIADQLNRILKGSSEVYTLTGDDQVDRGIISRVRSSTERRIVAVGLRAAKAARTLDNKQVVFCQVVNYSDHDLISDNMKGVSAMPAPRKLFKDWKHLSPQLERVLVISGSGYDDFISLARKAALESGITLVHRVVDNDREFLYAAKRNDELVQGHWLLADNRVLSVRTLKEVMSFNSKAAIQTVVFQPDLLNFGGLFYVAPSTLEIGDKVIARLEASGSGFGSDSADILFLDDHVMGINAQVAKQLGLKIPDHMKESVHDH